MFRRFRFVHGSFLFSLFLCTLALGDADAPQITSVAPNPATTTVARGPVPLIVTLSDLVFSDTEISLLSTSPDIGTVPSSLIVPAGQASAFAEVTPVAQGETQIIATLGNSAATAVVEVLDDAQSGGAGLTITGMLPFPLRMIQGVSSSMTITLNAPASQDLVLFLQPDLVSNVVVPASVSIPSGQSSATFPIQAVVPGTVRIYASLAPGGFKFMGIVQIQEPPPSNCNQAASAAVTAADAYAPLLVSVGNTCVPSNTVKSCRLAIAAAAAANRTLASARTAMLAACRPPSGLH